MLVIELDGPIHEGRKGYDVDRDEKLLSKGMKVLRIKNEELDDINNVIGIINKAIKIQIRKLPDNKQNITLPLSLKGRGRGKG